MLGRADGSAPSQIRELLYKIAPFASRPETAQIANREKREPQPLTGPKFALSGPDSLRAPCQNPAKAREVPGLLLGTRAKSLQPETKWRWMQPSANPSLVPVS